jgi:NADPH:quinone reductase-like Zn-dependent oxidoreductase
MKAIIYDSYGLPEVLRYIDVPNPSPSKNQVLIKTTAVGVGPGDCKTRAGKLHDHHPAVFPKTPGRSGVGTVVQVGPDTDASMVGAAVFFSTKHDESGCCVEFLTRPLSQVTVLDPKLDPIGMAALMHPALCAWLGLVKTAQLEKGMSVLIHGGAGAIGALAVQLARHLGAEVTSTASMRNAAYVNDLGAKRVIAYDDDDFTRLGAQFDIVFDLVGGPTHSESFKVLKADGILVYLTAEPIEPTQDFAKIRRHLVKVDYEPSLVEKIARLAADGALIPQISRVLPFSRGAEAHRMVEDRTHGRGRLVLVP